MRRLGGTHGGGRRVCRGAVSRRRSVVAVVRRVRAGGGRGYGRVSLCHRLCGCTFRAALPLQHYTRRRIEANLDTPCVNSPRSLLVAAAAATLVEDEGVASALEEEADAL